MAYQTFLQEYMQIPIVTRVYTTSCVITTLAVVSGQRKILQVLSILCNRSLSLLSLSVFLFTSTLKTTSASLLWFLLWLFKWQNYLKCTISCHHLIWRLETSSNLIKMFLLCIPFLSLYRYTLSIPYPPFFKQ